MECLLKLFLKSFVAPCEFSVTTVLWAKCGGGTCWNELLVNWQHRVSFCRCLWWHVHLLTGKPAGINYRQSSATFHIQVQSIALDSWVKNDRFSVSRVYNPLALFHVRARTLLCFLKCTCFVDQLRAAVSDVSGFIRGDDDRRLACCIFCRTHMQDLKDVTNNVHYENYRSKKLSGVTTAVPEGKSKVQTKSVTFVLLRRIPLQKGCCSVIVNRRVCYRCCFWFLSTWRWTEPLKLPGKACRTLAAERGKVEDSSAVEQHKFHQQALFRMIQISSTAELVHISGHANRLFDVIAAVLKWTRLLYNKLRGNAWNFVTLLRCFSCF